MSPTDRKLKDGRQLERIDAYAKHWQKDLKTNSKVGETISTIFPGKG